MNKGIWIIIILTLIFVVLASVLFFIPSKKSTNNIVSRPATKVEGIQITSPKEGEQISSPIIIIGAVDGGGWSGFEGQVGTVKLLDYKGNVLSEGVLKATTDWTKNPIQFQTELIFDSSKIKGSATLFFSNENLSGMPDKDKKFGLPVFLK